MDQQDIAYALAKKVPDMQHRGFTIETAYGEIDIPAGAMADRLAKAVRRLLEAELIAQQKAEQLPQAEVREVFQFIFGKSVSK